MLGILATSPVRCIGIIALVFSVMFASICFESKQNVSSQSMNLGVAPTSAIAPTEA